MAKLQADPDDWTDAHHTHLEADAVCARCGAVNPEGTLLCKTCGNNLREQREQRLAGAQLAEAAALAPKRTGWLSKALAVFGILLVVGVALNIKRIEDVLLAAQRPSTSVAHLFWTGATADIYDGLLRLLDANPVTDDEIDLALSQSGDAGTYSGRYVLLPEDESAGDIPVGAALARQSGNKIEFVVRLDRGIEGRGDAWIETSGLPVARDSAAVLLRGEYYVAYGFAMRRDDAGWNCMASSEGDDAVHSVRAYRIPGSESLVPTASPQEEGTPSQ